MEKKGKNCCGQLNLSKLGACKFCIILAIILNIVFWSGYFVINKYLHVPFWVSVMILIFNSTIALVLVAHIIVFLGKKYNPEL